MSSFGKNGPLFIINMITDGKWWFSFEVAAQNQMQHHTILQAGDPERAAAEHRETHERDPVVLGARGEEERLVA